ncbi:MAG: uracil phosphoribosyltransferase [Clostridium sp.]|jgi:uracil permease|nr:uracil phosphoribosyltransferase [Clostridium sp.]
MEETKLLLDVNEKPTIGKWIILAIQHVFAMFGATILVPILVNSSAGTEVLTIPVALATSGIGTLIYILCTKGRSPVYLGSSFAFIAPLTAAYLKGGISGAMTGIMVVGLIYVIFATLIHFIGKDWIHKLLPHVVIGPMIMIIGLGLAPNAISQIGLGTDTQIEWKGVIVAIITFLTTAIVMVRGKGFLKIVPFLIGIVVGYIAAICLGLVDFTPVAEAAFFSMPNFILPFVNYAPNFSALLTIAPIALVTMAEHIGDHTALGSIVGKDLLKNPGLDRTLLGDGIATFVAGMLGGPANTTYGENTSVVGMTKVASVWVIGLAAIIAICLAFLGKFTALISTIPNPVLGGVSLLLYGFIAVNGLKVLIENHIDFGKSKNIVVASTMLVLGLGGAAISIVSGDLSVTISGMSLAAIVGILLNLLLPDEKGKNTEEKQADENKEITEASNETKREEKNEDTKVIAENISENKIEGKKMNINVLDNPIIEHKLSIIRNKNTGTKEFREIITEIAIFLCYEAMKDAKLEEVEIETPLCKTKAKVLKEDNYAFVPILRAGTGMLDGLLQVIPNAKIGHIGLYRNEETLEPVKYYYKMPKDISKREVLILDPMLATGGSASDTIKCLKEDGVKKIKFLSILAAPEGIERLNKEFPDVELYTAAIDEKLNEHGYILPGLGDAGDRIFGTK